MIEIDRRSFNINLKQLITSLQSKRRPVISSISQNQRIHFRKKDLNKTTLIELQQVLRQQNIKLFRICYIFTTRFTTMRYLSSGREDDSCLLFMLGSKPSIGFIQNIIQVRDGELLLRISKVNTKDQLRLSFNNRKVLCPNIFYGDIDVNDNSIFIKSESIIEKMVYVYNKKLKCYIFCRTPNLCESS